MKYHRAIWQSICYIAQINNTTCSGLAKMCDLDATIFNPSKRQTSYGQPRWISTATLAKVLHKTNTTPIQFAEIMQMFLDPE